MKPRLATTKALSKRKFSFATEDRIASLKEIQLKKKTEAKMNWAVTAFVEWRNERLRTFRYDPAIYFSDISKLDQLEQDNFSHALCHFIPEVTKVRGDGPYPGKTLYQMIVALQKYLNVNGIYWQLVEGIDFRDVRTVLDNVMKERAALNVGIVKKQVSVITYEMENHLWKEGFLGEDTPDKLRNTVLFLIGINVYLHAIEEHYGLRQDMPNQVSQISFEYNSIGVKCLVYREDSVTKSHDGGLADMRNERKIVWVYPSENVNRCPVRLTQKYLSLCPQYQKKPNFYLQARQKFTPTVWYAGQVVGQNSLAKVVQELMKEAKIEGFFTNHSLRRSGGTRLFNAGVNRKLVKEATGHRSDAVDQYQITNEAQHQAMSKIIAGENVETSTESVSAKPQIDKNIIVTDQENSVMNICKCQSNDNDIDQMVEKIVKATRKEGKTKIKIEIEICNE